MLYIYTLIPSRGEGKEKANLDISICEANIAEKKRKQKTAYYTISFFVREKSHPSNICTYLHIYISIQVSNSLYLSNYLSTYTSFFLYFLSLHAFRLTTIRKKLFTLQNIPECHISLALIYLKLSFLPTFCTCYSILGRDCSVRKI